MKGIIGQWLANRKQEREDRTMRSLILQEQKILRKDAEEKRKIAAAFNDRYCMATVYVKDEPKRDTDKEDGFDPFVKRGYRWMCPECNVIHAPLRYCGLGGLIYPRCCSSHEGRRADELGKTGNLKRPLGWCGPQGLYRKMLDSGLRTIR